MGRRNRVNGKRAFYSDLETYLPHSRDPRRSLFEFRASNFPVLRLGPGFAEAGDFVAVLELSALAEQLDTLEALEDVAFRRDGAGAFETAVL